MKKIVITVVGAVLATAAAELTRRAFRAKGQATAA
jgi:hypothetical protein